MKEEKMGIAYNADYYQSKINSNNRLNRIADHVKDIQKRSITPETHKARLFPSNEEIEKINYQKVNELKSSTEVIEVQQESQFYIDEYKYDKHQTSRVLHFGINIYNDLLKKELDEYNTSQLKEPNEEKKIESNSNNSEKKSNKKKEEVTKITPTEYEKLNTTNAMKFLSKNEDEEKTVLIDVFERDKSTGKIQFDDDIPKIHTVVLYKQDDKFLVIDPSNPTFSHVLAMMKDILVCCDSKFQIYKSKGETGYGMDMWRDCIDISVKLAFALNQSLPQIEIQKESDVISSASLKELSAVKEITNQKEIYNNLPKFLENNYIRTKQSSDTKESKLVTFYLKKWCNLNLDIKDKFEDKKYSDPYNLKEQLNKIDEKIIKSNNVTHQEHIEIIKNHVMSLSDFVNKASNTSYMEKLECMTIIGTLPDNIAEWE